MVVDNVGNKSSFTPLFIIHLDLFFRTPIARSRPPSASGSLAVPPVGECSSSCCCISSSSSSTLSYSPSNPLNGFNVAVDPLLAVGTVEVEDGEFALIVTIGDDAEKRI